jgi:hypothetical protein
LIGLTGNQDSDMKLIEFEAVMLFFSVIFGVLGMIDWLTGTDPFTGLFIVSFFFLLVKNAIDIVDRISFKVDDKFFRREAE